MTQTFWTNPSVLALSGDRDPIQSITSRARSVVFRALERGWSGPPFDPFSLAEILSIETRPTSEVLEARTIPLASSRFRIEFNPDRPNRRIRYSIFHEIAHTLFPDCARAIRNRGVHAGSRRDDWQLEMLCNVAAGEFLLPTGSFGQERILSASIDAVLDLRQRYEASSEAALLRIQRLTGDSALAFSSHRDDRTSRYVVEYAVASNTDWRLRPGTLLPAHSAVDQCTAIGYTAKESERWPQFGPVRIECLGIAPFPRDIYPRVLGFIRPERAAATNELSITYVRGDATRPRGHEHKILVQVVNDSALTWGGGGFATSVKRRWPDSQRLFTDQVVRDRAKLRLGNVITFSVEPNLTLVNIVAQHGYGTSMRPLVRYGALQSALVQVVLLATELAASVHMPRIGTGQAGGSWPVVEEIIKETLVGAGLKVFVYDLPQSGQKPKPQANLAFGT